MFGELKILLFVCFRSVHGWMGMDVWVYVCLYDAILLRRLWTVEKYVLGHLPSFLAVTHHDIAKEGDKWTKASCLVSWGFYSLFVLGVCMAGWEWMCEWISWEYHSCAQTLERGERCPAWGAAESRQEKFIVFLFWERALLPGDVLLFVEHICKWFLSVLS